MRSVVRFLLGLETRAVEAPHPTMTVLDHLRACEHRMGTKEGCAEGDCGACTVVVGRPVDNVMRYEAVNACIRFLPTLDGCQLLTVEDLTAGDGGLHPVQQAIVLEHGSQCGFCTPGFVMSLWSMWQRRAQPTPELVDDLLAGNLCRCTGYGPLAAAAGRLVPAAFAPDAVLEGEAGTLAQLERWAGDESLGYARDGHRYWAPTSVGQLAGLLLTHPEAVLVAGATDVGLWVTKQDRDLPVMIYLGRIAELRRMEEHDGELVIGAAVTYREAAATIGDLYPEAGELLRRLGGVQVRNCGTIGGNIANGSPIGDMPPFLIAADATLVLRRGDERRTLPLEDFFVGYRQQDRRPGEFVEAIRLPRPQPPSRLWCWKITKRQDQDITAVCGAFNLTIVDGIVRAARIAFGGMAAVPARARAAEAALIGRPWSAPTVEAAAEALAADFTPLTDWRASAAYRMHVARNLLRKCWLDSSGQTVRLAPPRSSAFV